MKDLWLFTCIVFIFLCVHLCSLKPHKTSQDSLATTNHISHMKYEAISPSAPPSLVFIKTLMTAMQMQWREEAFVLRLHLCVACPCVCLLERNRHHLFASEDLIFCTFFVIHVCVSGSVCVFVCLSDPSVAPSSASSFSTPYQKRERTLDARMYHPC